MMLHTETVTPYLWDTLKRLMAQDALKDFRLVGGTALSLLLGHRMSIDIDLFTDIEYGMMDTDAIKEALTSLFPYIEGVDKLKERNLGYTLYCGNSEEDTIKLDMFYTDKFSYPVSVHDGIRIADVKDIAAMKILAINNSYRKKDYWDIHEMMNIMSLDEMVSLAEQMYPYTVERREIVNKLARIDVDRIDDVPIRCLKDKYWEFVIEDIEEEAQKLL